MKESHENIAYFTSLQMGKYRRISSCNLATWYTLLHSTGPWTSHLAMCVCLQGRQACTLHGGAVHRPALSESYLYEWPAKPPFNILSTCHLSFDASFPFRRKRMRGFNPATASPRPTMLWSHSLTFPTNRDQNCRFAYNRWSF